MRRLKPAELEAQMLLARILPGARPIEHRKGLGNSRGMHPVSSSTARPGVHGRAINTGGTGTGGSAAWSGEGLGREIVGAVAKSGGGVAGDDAGAGAMGVHEGEDRKRVKQRGQLLLGRKGEAAKKRVEEKLWAAAAVQ